MVTPVPPRSLALIRTPGRHTVHWPTPTKLTLDGIAPSIGTVGNAYDNALMETTNGRYEAECFRTTAFHDGPCKTIADFQYATDSGVE